MMKMSSNSAKERLINMGIQLVPLNNDSNFEMIDKAIALIKNNKHKTIVTPFETVVECTFSEGQLLLSQINELCMAYDNLTWLLNVRFHGQTGVDIVMEAKTDKHQ